MNLETYIRDLLYRFDCVVVPGLGAFLARTEPARIHTYTNAFYPPKKVLSFNHKIHHNDGLLVNYIAKSEGITYEKALQKINRRVDDLLLAFKNGAPVSLDQIGTLDLNEEHKIVFEPSYHTNYLTSAFGLSMFISPLIKREIGKSVIPMATDATVMNPVLTAAEKQSAQDETLDEEAPILVAGSSQIRQRRPYLGYAAAALLLLSAGTFGVSRWYMDQVENHNALVSQEAEKQLEQKIQQATFVIDSPLPAVTVAVTKKHGSFHVIAGAFRFRENAERKINQLKEQGFEPRFLGLNKYGLYAVAFQSFETREEASEALAYIRAKYNKDAWLMIQEVK